MNGYNPLKGRSPIVIMENIDKKIHRELSILKVKNVMKKPIVVKANDSIDSVLKHFSKGAEVLIVEQDGKLVGEIHKNDLLKLAVPEKYLDNEEVVGFMGFELNEAFVSEKAHSLMKKHEYTISENFPLGQAIYLMEKEEINALPVMNGKKLVGLIDTKIVLDVYFKIRKKIEKQLKIKIKS